MILRYHRDQGHLSLDEEHSCVQRRSRGRKGRLANPFDRTFRFQYRQPAHCLDLQHGGVHHQDQHECAY